VEVENDFFCLVLKSTNVQPEFAETRKMVFFARFNFKTSFFGGGGGGGVEDKYARAKRVFQLRQSTSSSFFNSIFKTPAHHLVKVILRT
jgi:hypothetical protein